MNTNRLWETFRTLIDIHSPSYGERQLCDALKERLAALGAAYYEDTAGEKLGGNCGNLYGYLPGSTGEDPAPLLFSAHMDTVEPSLGKRAILREDGKIVAEGETILGADDMAGISIILEALTRLEEAKIPHRPIELLFPVVEERYCLGSAVAEYDRISAKEAYVLDLSGAIGEAANAAPTSLWFSIAVEGKASHAGFAPLDGVNAIAAAAKAIAKLPLGEAEPGLTCNIGRIEGGEANNIVPALCTLTGEIRSLSHDRVLALWTDIQAVFEREAAAIGAAIRAEHRIEITAYSIPLNAPVVQRFQAACAAVGVPCNLHSTLGGSDNNNFALHGIQGLVMACSMHDCHSTRESSRLDELDACTRLVMELITQKNP